MCSCRLHHWTYGDSRHRIPILALVSGHHGSRDFNEVITDKYVVSYILHSSLQLAVWLENGGRTHRVINSRKGSSRCNIARTSSSNLLGASSLAMLGSDGHC